MLHEAITVMSFTGEWQGCRNILPCPAFCVLKNSLWISRHAFFYAYHSCKIGNALLDFQPRLFRRINININIDSRYIREGKRERERERGKEIEKEILISRTTDIHWEIARGIERCHIRRICRFLCETYVRKYAIHSTVACERAVYCTRTLRARICGILRSRASK